MKKLIELKNYFKIAISKLFSNLVSIEPIGNPNSIIKRIRIENEIANMKMDLYSQCFSCLTSVYSKPNIIWMTGVNPIPCNIKRIVLIPNGYVFLESIYSSNYEFSLLNKSRIERYMDVNQNGSYVINNFQFGNIPKRRLLLKRINCEINKLFVLDNKHQLDLRPYWSLRPNTQGDYYFCIQCNKFLHITKMNPKDYGVCSINCGMKLRGLSYNDFI